MVAIDFAEEARGGRPERHAVRNADPAHRAGTAGD